MPREIHFSTETMSTNFSDFIEEGLTSYDFF